MRGSTTGSGMTTRGGSGAINPHVTGVPMEALMRVGLFAELEPEEVRLLADAMEERLFPAGETATLEGGPGDGFYVVESGEATITVGGEPVGRLGPGDHFGEIALLMGTVRAATITAESDLHCYGLSPSSFRTIVEADPVIAFKLMQSMTQTLS